MLDAKQILVLNGLRVADAVRICSGKDLGMMTELTTEQRADLQAKWDALSDIERTQLAKFGIDSPEKLLKAIEGIGTFFKSFSEMLLDAFESIAAAFRNALKEAEIQSIPPNELPVFELSDGRKVYPPYILNHMQEYENRVSMGDPEALGEVRRFDIMQAYYGGFAKACAFVDMLHSDPQPVIQQKRPLVMEAIKNEIKDFSKANRELGAKLGVGHVKVKS